MLTLELPEFGPQAPTGRKLMFDYVRSMFAQDGPHPVEFIKNNFETYRFDKEVYPIIKTDEEFKEEKLDLSEVPSRYVAFWLYGPISRFENYNKNLPIDECELYMLVLIFSKLMHEKKCDYLGCRRIFQYQDCELILKLIGDITNPSDEYKNLPISRQRTLGVLLRSVNFNFRRINLHPEAHGNYAPRLTLDWLINFNLSTFYMEIPPNPLRNILINTVRKSSKPWSVALHSQYPKVAGFCTDAKHLLLLAKRLPGWFLNDIVYDTMLPILYDINNRSQLSRFREFLRLTRTVYDKSHMSQEQIIKELFRRKVIPDLKIIDSEAPFYTITIAGESTLNDQLAGLDAGYQLKSNFKQAYRKIALRQYYESQKLTRQQVERFLRYRNIDYQENMTAKELLTLIVDDAFDKGVHLGHFNLTCLSLVDL